MSADIDSIEKIFIEELEHLVKECQVQSKSKNPKLGLIRISNSLSSILKSLKLEQTSETNPLTEREAEILFYVSQGFTNREISQGLNLSEKTIEYHLKSIFKKTHSSTRTEAVKNGLKNKWIS